MYHCITVLYEEEKIRIYTCLTQKLKYNHCQKYKLPGKGYGLLPEKNVVTRSWHEMAVNSIGPWKVKVKNKVVIFNALTAIDIATNLVAI